MAEHQLVQSTQTVRTNARIVATVAQGLLTMCLHSIKANPCFDVGLRAMKLTIGTHRGAVMRETPRHLFVPESARARAYGDHPLPIGGRQTISQPYIVAAMTELLRPEPGDVMLEIGTGSGYQAAVLAQLVKKVYSIEILPELADRAKRTLADTGHDNVVVITGDGYRGLPEKAPFDGIIVTAAPGHVPPALVEQLGVGARLVIPVGDWYQELQVWEKTASGVKKESVFPVRFVPMTGEAEKD